MCIWRINQNVFYNCFTVKSVSSATLQSCSVTCSHMRILTKDSCNIYFVENGICRVGILDNPDKYAQAEESSSTLVPVKVVDSTAVDNPGEKVKPGDIFLLWLLIRSAMVILSYYSSYQIERMSKTLKSRTLKISPSKGIVSMVKTWKLCFNCFPKNNKFKLEYQKSKIRILKSCFLR